MGKGSAPAAPDPVATAEAQTASNLATATTQAQLNNVNQVTPYGNLTYTQEDVGGTPQYTATQTLSDVGQQLFDSNAATQQNLSNLGQEQSSKLSGLLSEDFSLDNDAVEGRLLELGRKRLDPMMADRRASLEANLVGRGIRPGSTAYDKSINTANQGDNDAMNQLLLSGRQQSVNEAITSRQAPINEIIALASGSQLQGPSYAQTANTGVAGTDIAGITQQGYNNQMNAYNQKQSQMGDMFGTAANMAMMFSDRRLKTDIKKIGKSDKGQNIYSYRYKAGGPSVIGMMAQEVEKTNPEAVATHESGFKMVDYEKATA